MLITPEKLVMEKSLQLGFLATNNEAEYEALLAYGQLARRRSGGVVFRFSVDGGPGQWRV